MFSLDLAGGNYRIFTRGGGNSIYEADATVGPNGTWQHVVGVYDDVNATISIYVNGELSGTGDTRPAGLRASSSPVTIGSKHLGNDPNYDGYFTGNIDEVVAIRRLEPGPDRGTLWRRLRPNRLQPLFSNPSP
jgi:hypothetical protein